MSETLIHFGESLKAMGDGKIAGYLCVFGDEKNVDLVKDFFTPETDFDLTGKTDARFGYYNHGLDVKFSNRKIGVGELTKTDLGVWVEAQLDLRDDYASAVYKLVEQGACGLSSGALHHLVRREKVGNAYKITHWPIGEWSVTPTPAEPRTSVIPLKSLLSTQAPDELDAAPEADEKPDHSIKGIFNTVLAEQAQEAMNPWSFLHAFERAFHKICEAGEAASLLPTTVNFNALIDEAVSEFSARLRQWAYDEFQKHMQGESDMMPSYLSIRTPLKTLVSLKSNPHAGMRFQQHSETLLAAVEEFSDEGQTLIPVLKAWGERNTSIVIERNIKEGRAISSASKGRMEAACMKIQSAKAEMQGVHDALQELIALAAPKQDAVKSDEPPAPEPDTNSADGSLKFAEDAIAQEFARFIKLTAGIAA